MIRAICMFALLFVFLPYDTQITLLSPLRFLVTTALGQAFLLGLLGGVIGAGFIYNVIHNQAMRAIYHEDVKKAEEAYRRRKR